MSVLKIFLVTLGLCMDSFAIAGAMSLERRVGVGFYVKVSVTFALVQAVLFLLGYFTGLALRGLLRDFTNVVGALFMLAVGFHMIYEAFKESSKRTENIGHFILLWFALITSIDAAGVGASFALLGQPYLLAMVFILLQTLCISAIGVELGQRVGVLVGNRAEIVGGLILVFLAVKLFLEIL